jgi:hypothetical protein
MVIGIMMVEDPSTRLVAAQLIGGIMVLTELPTVTANAAPTMGGARFASHGFHEAASMAIYGPVADRQLLGIRREIAARCQRAN